MAFAHSIPNGTYFVQGAHAQSKQGDNGHISLPDVKRNETCG
jgi:hypothetical protein